MSAVVIGCRWSPQHVVRRDDELGVFCEVNSPIYSSAEIQVQRALLSPITNKVTAQRIAEAMSAKRATTEQP